MKLVRFMYQEQVRYGSLEGDTVHILEGGLETGFRRSGQQVELHAIRLLSPVQPSKAVCVGLNYLDHIKEMGHDLPEEPVIFLKPATAVIGPGENILHPSSSARVDYEGELAVVIGKRARNLTEQQAKEAIFGYTCANDVTARDLQRRDGQWTRAKGFDTFLPLGPCISTELNPAALSIKTHLNGKTVQSSNTDQLLFPIPRLISFVTSVMTLEPGDVVLTGTSSGIGPMKPGDSVVVEIEGIGQLENFVASGL